MSLVTEAALRAEFTEDQLEALDVYRVPAGTIVTPSARALLIDHRVDLMIGDKHVIKLPQPDGASATADDQAPSALPAFTKPDRYQSLTGQTYTEKPEHMTALRGHVLVAKDHPQIRFRGQLDSLEAKILCTQLAFQRLGLHKGVADLTSVLLFVKQILRAEVLDEPLGPVELLGLSDAELRRQSHNPREVFGVPHFAASLEDGEAVIALNALRTAAREVELAAYEAFKQADGTTPEHEDIILALNRLSSAFYLMMFKAKAGEYQ
ncbi:MAG: hypothetical protein LBR27_09100 [Bifidobacteriaceae bacterium]|jgi:ethanolamine utilization cobalamin adenosyltransferase|nr:hypothetical protein [Bifidobacteriaceae bacterium]